MSHRHPFILARRARRRRPSLSLEHGTPGRRRPPRVASRPLPPAPLPGGQGGAEDKIAAMEAAGIRVSPSPSELGTTLDALLKELA